VKRQYVCVLKTVLTRYRRLLLRLSFCICISVGHQHSRALSLSGRLPFWQINTLSLSLSLSACNGSILPGTQPQSVILASGITDCGTAYVRQNQYQLYIYLVNVHLLGLYSNTLHF